MSEINNGSTSVDISIITPCYNMLPHLKKCVHSVSDQEVKYEHIVIDGNSTDGTKQWLENSNSLKWVSEKDAGMYDALNKGLKTAEAEVIGHINADEQYLPGTLKFVIDFFNKNPDIDYIVADFLLIDEKGKLKAFRKAFPPFWPFFFSNYMYTFTCTLFYRKRVIDKLQYNTQLKSVADADFVRNLHKMGFRGRHVKQYFSVFMFTGKNLSFNPLSAKEKKTYEKEFLPGWFSMMRPALKLGFYMARIIYGTLWHVGPIQYNIYTDDNLLQRTEFIADQKTWKWM